MINAQDELSRVPSKALRELRVTIPAVGEAPLTPVNRCPLGSGCPYERARELRLELIESLRRAESVVELAVHACGTDLDEAPAEVALVLQDAIFTGVTFADLRFRDAAGAVTEPQTLYGVASHRQTVVLTIFEDKGRYFRRTYPWLDGVLSNDDASPIDPLRYRFPRPRDGRQLDRPAEPPEGGVEEPT